jgi:hypothetical protein
MPRVYGLHMVELRPGKTPEAFERFVIDEYLPALAEVFKALSGIQVRLLRCNRGVDMGKYLFMFEFESEETRDRYFPAPETPGEELKRFIEPLRPLTTRWEAFSKRTKNDYVVIES